MNNHLTSHADEKTVEAARYALTRRLLPVLRHHMVVHLQPIGMIYEVLDRKLAGEPDLGAVREGLTKINHLARSAVSSCLDVVTWLAPDAAALTPVGRGVDDCLGVLRSNFMFRGFTISNQVGELAPQVSQAALREVLTAALIAATDGAAGPLEVIVGARLADGRVEIDLGTRPAEGEGSSTEGEGHATAIAYRVLQWSDVQALGQAHGVALSHDGAQVQITFPVSDPGQDGD